MLGVLLSVGPNSFTSLKVCLSPNTLQDLLITSPWAGAARLREHTQTHTHTRCSSVNLRGQRSTSLRCIQRAFTAGPTQESKSKWTRNRFISVMTTGRNATSESVNITTVKKEKKEKTPYHSTQTERIKKCKRVLVGRISRSKLRRGQSGTIDRKLRGSGLRNGWSLAPEHICFITFCPPKAPVSSRLCHKESPRVC